MVRDIHALEGENSICEGADLFVHVTCEDGVPWSASQSFLKSLPVSFAPEPVSAQRRGVPQCGNLNCAEDSHVVRGTHGTKGTTDDNSLWQVTDDRIQGRARVVGRKGNMICKAMYREEIWQQLSVGSGHQR